jgi:hypothetical protein
MAKPTFQTLFCQKFQCPEAEYETRALRRLSYWQGKILAPVIRTLSPKASAMDLQFIRYLGAVTGLREANAEIADFQEVNRSKPSFWRTSLRVRVSGRKAGAMAQRLFSGPSARSSRAEGSNFSRPDPDKAVKVGRAPEPSPQDAG